MDGTGSGTALALALVLLLGSLWGSGGCTYSACVTPGALSFAQLEISVKR